MDKQHNWRMALMAQVADGEEASRRVDAKAEALREEWFKIGHAFLAAKELHPSNQAFGEWRRRSPLERWSKNERACAMQLARNEAFTRKALEGTAVASAERMWERVLDLIRLAKSASSDTPEDDLDVCENAKQAEGDASAGDLVRSPLPKSDVERVSVVAAPRVPARPGDIEKAIGNDGPLVRGWYGMAGRAQVRSGLGQVKEKVILEAVAAAVKSGECVHAPVAGSDVFDIRMAFPHIPELVAKKAGRKCTWKTLRSKSGGREKSDWERFAELNDLCKARSTYVVEKPAPNGTYRLRDDRHEDEIGQAAWQWWHSGHWPGERPPLRLAASTPAVNAPPPQNNKEVDRAEAVYFGMGLWPLPPPSMVYINKEGDQAPSKSSDDPTIPTKQDLDNTYWFVEELHRVLVSRNVEHRIAAKFIRNWARYIGALQKPAAAEAVMRDMAQGIDTFAQNPDSGLDLKNKVPSRPTKFAVEG